MYFIQKSNMPLKKRIIHTLSLFSLIALTASVIAHEHPKIPEQKEKNLRTFFRDLLKKKVAVGGTVLMGDAARSEMNPRSNTRPLFLRDQDGFQVLPGSTTVKLYWDSESHQRWYLTVDDRTIVTEGGFAEIELPEMSSLLQHSWQLRAENKSLPVLSGYWFYSQDFSIDEASELTSILANYRTKGFYKSDSYQEVCVWMQEEMVINFNNWCL